MSNGLAHMNLPMHAYAIEFQGSHSIQWYSRVCSIQKKLNSRIANGLCIYNKPPAYLTGQVLTSIRLLHMAVALSCGESRTRQGNPHRDLGQLERLSYYFRALVHGI
jgi:hypothetical protein